MIYFRVQSHKGIVAYYDGGNPVYQASGLFTDTACTTMATAADQVIKGLKDPVGAIGICGTQSNTSKSGTLKYDQGVPVIDFDGIDDWYSAWFDGVEGEPKGGQVTYSALWRSKTATWNTFYSPIETTLTDNTAQRWGTLNGSTTEWEPTGVDGRVQAVNRNGIALSSPFDCSPIDEWFVSTQLCFDAEVTPRGIGQLGLSLYGSFQLIALIMHDPEDTSSVQAYLQTLKPGNVVPVAPISLRFGYGGYHGMRIVPRVAQFNPSDYGDNTLWLQSSSLSSFYDAQPVSEWSDSGPNGNDAIQATADLQLVVSKSGLVRSRSNRSDDGQFLNTPQVITGQSFTFFVLACVQFPNTTGDVYRTMIGFGASTDPDGGVFAVRSDTGKIALYLLSSLGGFDSYDGTGALTFTQSPTFRVFEVVAGGGNLSVYVDGVLDNTISIGPALAYSGALTISRPVARTYGGAIREVLVFDETLDEPSRAAVRNHLSSQTVAPPNWYYPSWNDNTTGALQGVMAWQTGMVGSRIPTTFSPASVNGTGDYSIIKRGSTYFMCYSNTRVYLDNTENFGVASSTDLSTWTEIATVDCSGVSGPHYHCGAPEWFVDEDDSVGVMLHGLSSDGLTRQFMVVRPTNSGMTTWETPQPVTWTIQPDDIIDAFPFFYNGNFAILFGNGGVLEVAEATSRLGPYTRTKSGDWAGWGGGLEGGSFILDSGIMTMVCDHFGDGALGLFYSKSSDGTIDGTWTTPVPVGFQMQGEEYPRHCTPIII